MKKNIEGVYLDTNILINLHQIRNPQFKSDIKLIEKCTRIPMYISSLTVMNVIYTCKLRDRDYIKKFFSQFNVLNTSKVHLANALKSDISDFEDAVQLEIAREYTKVFVTWNTKDFKDADDRFMVLNSKEVLKLIK